MMHSLYQNTNESHQGGHLSTFNLYCFSKTAPSRGYIKAGSSGPEFFTYLELWFDQTWRPGENEQNLQQRWILPMRVRNMD